VSFRIGVDVGGTFTDVALLDDDLGRVHLFKIPTTPDDPSTGALAGIRGILDATGTSPADVAAVGHGTTVATNAILEGRTARVGLITTEGFRDLLEIGRQRRPKLFDLGADRARPLVLRRHRRELPERVLHDGRVARALGLDALAAILADFQRDAIASLAVCFLHAYANPAHERAVRDAVHRRWPDVPVSLSSEVAPEFREFERFSTTAVNAALIPLMRAYLESFERRVCETGIAGTTYLSQSSGGVMTLPAGGRLPAATLFSGPAAGVTGAIAVGRQAGFDDLLTFDMGGTSTDVCLVRGGEAVVSGLRAVQGHPVRLAAVDVHSVGAGGGSAASLDAGGFLRVGPASVGAVPGPACYGRGGTRPAVTDANVVLGRLNPAGLLAGRLPLHPDRSAQALLDAIGTGRGLSAVDAARGVLDVVNSNMVRALRVVSVERGWDPRDFTLVAFGGAGPLHATDLARELGARRVLVPAAPGVLCAIGLLVADLRSDASRTFLRAADGVSGAEITRWFEDVRALAEAQMAAVNDARVEERRWLDMRYAGQNYELRVPVPVDALGDSDVALLVKRYHEAHRRRHGYDAPEATVQIVNARVALRVPPAPLPLSTPPATRAPEATAKRDVFFEEAGRFVACPVWWRDALPAGFSLHGPAVVEQMDSTLVVPPDVTATVHDSGHLVLEVG
jgi:N-methylhydantoinase A